jgi:hypothetical protein
MINHRVLDVRKITSDLEHMILTILLFAGAENTNSWHTR